MNSFDLLKFRNQLLTENTDRFYAPDYIAQKYGADKAKEIEANIEDEGANTWDLYKSLETSQEVDNFIDGFMSEGTINEDLSYLAAWKVLKGPGGYIFQIQGGNRDTIGARVNKAGMVTLDGEGAGAAQAVQQIADQFGTETEVLYGDDSLTTVISEPDFNAIFPDTISEAKMTKADEVGSDGVAEEDALDEGTLEEMASFYKVADDSPEAKAAIAAAKEKYKPGTTLYNTLDTLEKTGEIDYKELAKSTGKDMATFNNPKSRDVLEKDLAAFVQAGSSPSAVRTGRPADPNKVAAPKDKSPKLKITNPKPKSNSTKLKDLAPTDVFMGAGADEEEIGMDKEAMKAAKNADAELGDELGKVSGLQAAKDFLKRNASKTLNIVKKSNAGQELTSNEQKYLDKTRKLTSLIKKDKASFTASNISGQEEA
jgi:hypothetical protein